MACAACRFPNVVSAAGTRLTAPPRWNRTAHERGVTVQDVLLTVFSGHLLYLAFDSTDPAYARNPYQGCKDEADAGCPPGVTPLGTEETHPNQRGKARVRLGIPLMLSTPLLSASP